ncbi:MAG: glutathione S-transferase family protein [Beijerinckiaceae bacterium]
MAIELYELAGADERIRFSPYCWRARLALAHKGLEVRTIPVRFGEKHKIEFSGQKLVPVLRDSGIVVSDSWNIALYLDEAYPERPRLMDGAQAAALCKFVQSWVQMRLSGPVLRTVLVDIHDVCSQEDRIYFRKSREERLGKPLEEAVMPEAEGRAALKAELAPMRELLGTQAFLSGAAPAYADYIVFGAFMWARGVSAKNLLDEDDPVYAWRERMLDLFDGLARKAPAIGA